MLFAFNKKEELIAILGMDKQSACPYFNANFKEQINGENSFVFSVLSHHEQASQISEGCYVAFKDRDGDFQMFEVKNVEDSSEDMRVRTYSCENACYELLDDYLSDIPMLNTTPKACLDRILRDTRWETGIVDITNVDSTRFYRENVISGIKNKMAKWNGELKFRVVIEGNQITHRYVDFLSQRGQDNGVRFQHTKDIISTSRTVDITDLKTALYGFGRGEELDEDSFGRRITFANIEWSVANGDPLDKPLGQEWIGDPTALAQWGRQGGTRHRFGTFENKDEEDSRNLLWQTYGELVRLMNPLISYELNVVDLSQQTGYEHKKFRLGDTITIVDRDFSPPLLVKSRIVEWEQDLNSPENTKLILENRLPDFTDTAIKIEQLQQLVHERQGIWDGERNAEIIEYKTGVITGTSALLYFNNSFVTNPSIMFSIQDSTNNYFKSDLVKAVNTDGAEIIVGTNLTFMEDQVGKTFGLIIVGG